MISEHEQTSTSSESGLRLADHISQRVAFRSEAQALQKSQPAADACQPQSPYPSALQARKYAWSKVR